MLIEALVMLATLVGPQAGQPEGTQPEALPDGMQRTTDGGLRISTLPTYEPALAAAAKITQRLSVASLRFGEEGRLRGFTARYWGEQPLPVGSSFSASSITLDGKGILMGITFAGDTGCNMMVTLENGVYHFDCVVTTCPTVCDMVLNGPPGGPYIITYACREDDPE